MPPTTAATDPESLDSLSLPLRTRIQLSLLNLVTDSVRRSDLTINRRLMGLLDRRVPPSAAPSAAVSSHDFALDPSRPLSFRLFVPRAAAPSASPLPVVVFFHGGGFAFLSAASAAYDAACRRFCRRLGAVVVSVDYRLSPEHKFPAQYDDGLDVLRFLDDPDSRRRVPHWPENADVSRCFVAGDSAGGNLAHNVAVSAARSAFSHLRVIGLVNIQPFFGGKNRAKSEINLDGAPIISMARTEWMWKAFLPEGLDEDHWSVNVSGPNAVDISGLDKFPPTLVFIGGFDPLKDWQRKYTEWLGRQGKEVKVVEYPTAIHAFYVFPELKEAPLLYDEVKEFVEKQCAKVDHSKM